MTTMKRRGRLKHCHYLVHRIKTVEFFSICLKNGEKKHSIQINPLEDNFETELLKTKLMFADNCQPVSFVLMKINVDANKGGSKMPVSPECNGE